MNHIPEYKILIVEDSELFKDLVCQTLGPSFDILWAENLKQALEMISENELDLVLLDVSLPDGDGFRFFSMLLYDYRYKNIPVIFLTANDSVSDKVMGISLGAEDYIVKPFEPAEFKARIEMRIKKTHIRQQEKNIIRKGKIEINVTAQRVFIVSNNQRDDLLLTPLEYKLLMLLSTNEDQVFSRNQLFDKVWGPEVYLTDRCVDTHIYSLRKKLGELSPYIQAVYGEGYRFTLTPREPHLAQEKSRA